MGVYIKGMEMPKNCEDCPLENCDENYYGDESNHRCSLIYKGYTSNNRYEKRRDDCPLIPVPPHGDLIDREPFIQFIKTHWDSYDQWFVDQLEARPTIIPAEEETT